MGVEQTGKSVILTHPSGSSAEVDLFGATIVSWKVDGVQRLFVSRKAIRDGTKPIRGGIPICFPVFGAPPPSPPDYAALSQHGFVRTQTWSYTNTILDDSAGVSIRLTAPAPISTFEHSYNLTYVITLTAHQLSTDIHVENTGSEVFKFQCLLHNYFAVSNASSVKINGLSQGVEYKDKVLGGKIDKHPGGTLVIDKETDRVYFKVPSQEIQIEDESTTVAIRFRGFEDCTIWNPQAETGAKIADMEDGGWDRYVCIEPGYVRDFYELASGDKWIGQQVLTIQ